MQQNPLLDSIPSLDLADFTSGDPQRKEKFVQELGQAFNNIGFIALKNHGLSEELRAQLYQSVETFFQLPTEIKTSYEHPELAGQRGYIGKGKETAKGHSKPDLKEFYHVGQPNPLPHMPENIFPTEVPEFKENTLKIYHTFEQTGKTLLQAIALYLELPEHYFDDKVTQGDSILRALHYFPIEDPDSLPDRKSTRLNSSH